VEQQRQGGVVRPMQVLKHQQQRRRPRQLGQRRGQGLQQPEAVQLLVLRLRERGVSRDRLGEQAGQPRAEALREPADRLHQAVVLTERLHERLVGGGGLVVGVPDQDLPAVGQDQPGQLRGQARLADPAAWTGHRRQLEGARNG
jgi:hypothetical protein